MASSATVLQSSDYDTIHTLFESLKDDMINKKTAFLTSIGVIYEGWTYTQYERSGHMRIFSKRYPLEIDNPLYKEAIAAEELYNSYIFGEIIPEGFTEEHIKLYYAENRRRKRIRNQEENAKIQRTAWAGFPQARWQYDKRHSGGGRRNYKNTIKTKIRRVKSHKRTRKSRNV